MSKKNSLQKVSQKNGTTGNDAPLDKISARQICLKRSQVMELLILAGLAILLLLYLLLRSAASFSYKLPRFEEVSDIQTIRWSRSGSGELTLRKGGEKWAIEEYPAKQNYADTLLEQLRRPSLQDLVSKSGSLLTFGLDSERAYKLEAFGDDGKPLRQFFVGKSSSSGRYSFVRLREDDARVFTLSENLTSVLEKSIDDLRDRLVLSFSSSDIEKLQIRETATAKSISAEKKDGKWQVPQNNETPENDGNSENEDEAPENGKVNVRWGEEQVNRLVNRFANMNAQSFLAEYPQGGDEYELKFVAKGGVNYTVTIAAQPNDDGEYAAKTSSYGFPFTLNNYTVESMLEDFGFVATQAEPSETKAEAPSN